MTATAVIKVLVLYEIVVEGNPLFFKPTLNIDCDIAGYKQKCYLG